MESNLKVRAFENGNLYGRHAPRALGFTYRLEKNFRDELYVLEGKEGELILLGGNGHIRMSVKSDFKKELGSEDPPFDAVFVHYSALGETFKDQVLKYCCR